MVGALQAGMSWREFLGSTYWVTQLRRRAHAESYRSYMEIAAWIAHHNYAAMCGGDKAPTVDDLLGRRRHIADFRNDPFALDKLADVDD